MRKQSLFFAVLFVALSMTAFAQATLIDGFDTIPGAGGWRTTMNGTTSGQNLNVADGGTLLASAAHVTEGTGCGMITLNWAKPATTPTGAGSWPGTGPVWGCRWFNSSGAALPLIPLADTVKIDVYNETGDAIQFALLLRDQGGSSGDLVRGPYMTLAPGANTYSFVPETEGVVWIVTGNGAVDGSCSVNAMLFTADNEPANGANVFYVDNLRREGAQVDTTAPAQAVLKAVALKAGTSDQVNVSWFANTESDLAGYRLYRAKNINLANGLVPISWETAPVQDETTLTAGVTETTVSIDAGATVTLFRVSAVDNATPAENEGAPSVALAVKLTGTTAAPQVLCVMDLKRYSATDLLYGGNGYKYDRFIMYQAAALNTLNEPFFSATGAGIGAGAVTLDPYAFKLVTWSTGVDGATGAPVVSAIDTTAISPLTVFLLHGGHLYLSGTYAALNLATTPEGQSLLGSMGVGSVGSTGGSSINAPVAGSIFEGITATLLTDEQWNFAAYQSTSNNVLSAAGATGQLTYATPTDGIAAVSRVSPGKSVLTGFAFESVRQEPAAASANARTELLQKILAFMGAAPEPITSSQSIWNIYE